MMLVYYYNAHVFVLFPYYIWATSQVAHAGNFHKISDMLHATCSRDFLRFGFSAKLCDALDKW